MLSEIPIKDIDFYNSNMSQGLLDKLFFVSYLNKEGSYIFVDYGCADGVLINSLIDIFINPNNIFIGYDKSEEMINLSKKKSSKSDNVIFTTNWEEIKIFLGRNNTVLILSSVIHEIYSYSSKDEIMTFWNRVLKSKFSFICIRDMMYSIDMIRPVKESIIKKINKKEYKSFIESFQKHWGWIDKSMLNVIHFLLKYRWTINWEREVNENYFPINIELLFNKMSSRYNCIYFKRFRVPFLEQCWKEDFDIELEDFTHVKAIFQIHKI